MTDSPPDGSGHPRAAPPARGGVRRRGWTRWLTLALGLALLGWVLSRASLDELARVLVEADPLLLVMTIGLGLLATALRSLRYAVFFPPGRDLAHWRRLYGAFALSRLLNVVMPLRSGELASLGLLKSQGLAPTIAETLPVWLVIRGSDVLALALWLVPASLLLTLPVGWPAMQWVVLAVLGALVAAAVGGVLFRMWQVRESDGSGWLHGRLRAFGEGWHRVRGKGRIGRVAFLAVAISAAVIGINTMAQLAFGSPLPWHVCWLFSAAVLGVTMLPVHGPLGLGTVEVSWVGLMVLFEVPTSEAIAIALGIRLVTLVILLLDGAIGALLLTTSVQSAARS
ncbi:MAG: flippase-like domain-containing protein [Thermoanaerobaculia bacterium]|nr:flippase-like domain-containing protein [Thermoanaerobaculia bacterium]